MNNETEQNNDNQSIGASHQLELVLKPNLIEKLLEKAYRTNCKITEWSLKILPNKTFSSLDAKGITPFQHFLRNLGSVHVSGQPNNSFIVWLIQRVDYFAEKAEDFEMIYTTALMLKDKLKQFKRKPDFSNTFAYLLRSNSGEEEILSKVKLLLEIGALRSKKKTETALHIAVNRNFLKVAETFVGDKDTNVNATDEDNKTCIYCACDQKNLKMVKLLLGQGDALKHQEDVELSPLQSTESIKIISTSKCRVDVNKPNSKNISPIHVAVKNQDLQIVELLIGQMQT